MSDVRIEQLAIHLGGRPILEGLDLQIAAGEFLVLLGPSGCGKSTLLHSIAGLIDVHDGRIAIGGQDVTWADPKDRGIGMVFQSYALYPTMTVERNLSFGPRIAGVPKAEIAQRVQRVAAMLQLGELLQRKPAQLSGGQRQRVGIGRALVRQAAVFLFDEPLSNLDAQLRAELRRELKQLHQQLGATMVYVTHDQVEAMTLATRIAVMKGGRIQQIDTPAAVYGRPANRYVAGFLGSPGMNFIEGRIERAPGPAAALQFVAPGLRADLAGYAFASPGTPPEPGRAATLGVRPEHLRLLASVPARDLADGTADPDDLPAGQFRARVRLIEPMGANQVVWLDAQGLSLAADLDAQTAVAPDEIATWSLQGAPLSLFDPTSGQRI